MVPGIFQEMDITTYTIRSQDTTRLLLGYYYMPV